MHAQECIRPSLAIAFYGMGGNTNPPTFNNVQIVTVGSNTPELDCVKALWRANSHTLGLLPEGAFDDYAVRGTILAAATAEDGCIGYVLYRLSKERAAVVHLCVADKARGHGVARLLMQRLIDDTRDTAGVGLRCRRDYPSNSLWPRLGFSFHAELVGRGKDAAPLLFWWRPNQHTTLFSSGLRADEGKVTAVMDANILFDLREQTTDKSLPSKALLADWLEGQLELVVTDETFNEISRQDDPTRRADSNKFAKRFPCLPCSSDSFEQAYRSVRPIFPDGLSDRRLSDVRQLARAIGGEADFFITRDVELLGYAEQVENSFGVIVLHPAQLVSHFDELRRQTDYQPVRFEHTTLSIRLVAKQNREVLADRFLNGNAGERKSLFLQRFDALLAQPDAYRCSILQDGDGTPLALIAAGKAGSKRADEIEVPILRVSAGKLTRTLARQVARQLILSAVGEKALFTRVNDGGLQQEVQAAISEAGFFQAGHEWLKLSIPVVETAEQLATRLMQYREHLGSEAEGLIAWAGTFRNKKQMANPATASEQEHVLWPAKITDAGIPTYLVPIQPRWAEELFEHRMASQRLFNRQESLALNVEAVYYRSTRGVKITAPARVLWYVTADQNTSGAKQLRACSRLVEVAEGRPKDLYRRFQRLGVYQWEQVYATARHDVNNPIMAIRFSDTELFDKPVQWKVVEAVLRDHGCSTSPVGPIRLPNDAFLKLYSAAAR